MKRVAGFPPNCDRAAYTLIEVLVALAVLIAGFTALSTMTNRARRAAIAAEELSIVQLACQTRINELLAGVRPITPSFNEPVAELDYWYMTTELFPASKRGLTVLRVQMQRERQPGDATGGYGGGNSFEISSWVDNTRLDQQIVQALQRNPYAMMIGGQTQGGMFGNPGMGMSGGMMGGSSIADSMAATGMGMMPAIPGGATFDMQSGMSGSTMGGGLPMFDMTGAGDDIPPLSLGDDSGGASTGSTSFDRGGMFPPGSPPGGAFTDPPPLDLPIEIPVAPGSPTTSEATAETTTETVSGETSSDVNVGDADTLPDPEGESDTATTDESETAESTEESETEATL